MLRAPRVTEMMAIWARVLPVFLLLASPALAGSCRDMDYEGQSYTVCEATADADVRLFLDDADGADLGTFQAVDDLLAAEGRKLGFAMNAGMYHPDRKPVGLYVENGEEKAGLQKRAGPGNFGMQPNGEFGVAEGGYSVTETLAFD